MVSFALCIAKKIGTKGQKVLPPFLNIETRFLSKLLTQFVLSVLSQNSTTFFEKLTDKLVNFVPPLEIGMSQNAQTGAKKWFPPISHSIFIRKYLLIFLYGVSIENLKLVENKDFETNLSTSVQNILSKNAENISYY